MKAITQYLQQRGFTCAQDDYYSAIALWQKWYKGKVPAVHNYTQYNGKKHLRRCRKTLGMAKTVSEDWANLLLNERVAITVQKQKAQQQIMKVLDKNHFWIRGNQLIELSFALGTGAFVEFLDGDQVKIDYIRAGMIYPLAWDNGRITECAFASERTKGKIRTVTLNIHRMEDGQYIIENHVFERNGATMREQELPEGVEPEVRTGSAVPRFQVVTPNIANNIDPDSPLGISVYANALDQLESTDLVFDSYYNEYRLGKKRITVPLSLARIDMENDGTVTPTFDDNDTEFYAIPQEQGMDNKIQEHNMTIRAEDHSRGIQDMLNLVSWKCGFGTRRYIFQNGQVKTATEVISNDSDLYRNMCKHELMLTGALTGLVNAVADMLRLGPQEVTVRYDDSIIVDSDRERETDRQDVQDGLMQPYEYRMKWYGEDEKTAKEKAQTPASLTFKE